MDLARKRSCDLLRDALPKTWPLDLITQVLQPYVVLPFSGVCIATFDAKTFTN